jgi:hypothetical protein
MLGFARKRVSFTEHLDASMASTSTRISEQYPFLQFGFYYKQVVRYLNCFPRESLHIGFYEDYSQAPAEFLRGICSFLGVDPEFEFDFSERHMQATVPQSYGINNALKSTGLWDLARKLSPQPVRAQLRRLAFQAPRAVKLSGAERARLVEFYRPDMQNLASLLNRDLTAWSECARVDRDGFDSEKTSAAT